MPAGAEWSATIAAPAPAGANVARPTAPGTDAPTSRIGSEPVGQAALRLDFLAPAQAAGELGRLGPYRVLKVIGFGGMGVVLHGEDLALQRPVALKAMLPGGGVGSNRSKERFLMEARAAAALDHDHIVTIYQVGEDRGIPYMAMQLLQGESLEQRLRRLRKLTVPQVVRVGRETAAGLAAAHARGLIHRDVKPGNIWLDAQHKGRVVLLDFGLAREVSEPTHLTTTGAVLGTPAYMAPEQAAGEPVDGRADLFSLGCVLYRMATGRPPFKGGSVISILRAVALHEPKPLREHDPQLPAALSDLVCWLLAKEPTNRPPSAQAVVEALRQIERALSEPAPAGKGTAPLTPATAIPVVEVSAPGPATVAVPVQTLSLAPLPVAAPVAETPTVTWRGPFRPEVDRSSEGAAGPAVWPWLAMGGVLLLAFVVLVGLSLAFLGSSPEPQPGPPVGEKPPEPPPPPVPPLVQPLPLLRQLEGNRRGVWAVACDFDGQRGLSGGKDNLVCLWDLRTGDLVRQFPGHTGDVTGVAFAPDGRRFVSSGVDGLRLWDIEAGDEIRRFIGHTGGVMCVAFSPDGKRAASGGSDRSVRLWDVETGRQVQQCLGHTKTVRAVAFSADGSLVHSAGEDSTLHLWKADTGLVIRSFLGHKGIVYGAAISADGQHVLSGSADGTVRLWDAQTGTEIRQFAGHTDEVNGVAFTPDGRHALSTSDDLTVRVWDVASGFQLYQGDGHRRLVFAVAVAGGGRCALSGSFDGSVRLWDLSALRQP
jgi:serine/threonine protein kinase